MKKKDRSRGRQSDKIYYRMPIGIPGHGTVNTSENTDMVHHCSSAAFVPGSSELEASSLTFRRWQ